MPLCAKLRHKDTVCQLTHQRSSAAALTRPEAECVCEVTSPELLAVWQCCTHLIIVAAWEPYVIWNTYSGHTLLQAADKVPMGWLIQVPV